MVQIFDSDGTIDYSCSFLEKTPNSRSKRRHQWLLRFSQGFMSIYSPFTGLNVSLNFSPDDHWVYSLRESEYKCGAISRGAEIRHTKFVLVVDVREYLTPDDPEFDPEYDEEGINAGYLDLMFEENELQVCCEIPYLVALGIITIASGSTDIEGAFNIRKIRAISNHPVIPGGEPDALF